MLIFCVFDSVFDGNFTLFDKLSIRIGRYAHAMFAAHVPILSHLVDEMCFCVQVLSFFV